MIRHCIRGFLLAAASAGLAFGQSPDAMRFDIPKDCTCIDVPRPACQVGWHADLAAVFRGRVTSKKLQPEGGVDVVHFQVAEVLHGSLGPTAIVYVHTHRCSPFVYADPFEEGVEYLVYAVKGPNSEGLHLGSNAVVHSDDEFDDPMACTSKTMELKDAAEDLAYWRNLSRAPETGTVFGTAKEYVRELRFDDPSEERSFEMKPLAGQEIAVQSPDQAYMVKTDAVGRYELRSLLPGRYVVSPVDLGQSLFPTKVTAVVAAKGCAEVDFRRRGELLKLRKRLKPAR